MVFFEVLKFCKFYRCDRFLKFKSLKNIAAKGGSDGRAGGAWALPLFEALSKNLMLENNGDCGFQLSTMAIVTNTRWLINCDQACKNRPS